MSGGQRVVSEEELHAYVDGCLDAARRAEVEAHLRANPDVAARVGAYRQQNEALRAVYEPVMRDPIPPELARFTARGARWRRYGLAAAWALVWLAVGWFAHGLDDGGRQGPGPTLPRQAAAAHAVYTPEVVHPVEVTAEQQAHLVKWLSKRLGGEVKAPDLRSLGYELVGGRLLPSDDGAAAQFMYETGQGRRLTLYVRRDVADSRDTGFRYDRTGEIGVFYWIDRGFGYALSGELGKTRLLKVAHAVYAQLDN